MCGIFGCVGFGSGSHLEKCARTLAHRGPDGFGALLDETALVYFGHCRLAVIDLSSAGHQPMTNEDGSVWITYNGEVYNFVQLRQELEQAGHRFASRTDTEVIVHAYEQWGTECLARLNGIFAFGIWDCRRHLLFLARDRLGVKPLYYLQAGGRLAFASEPKALVGLPGVSRRIDPWALATYLAYRYAGGDRSMWAGIGKLLPGHALTFDAASGQVLTQRYWQPEWYEEDVSEADALERFEGLASQIVEEELVSDVPLGVFLSGGLDSSAVAALASARQPGVHTFTVGFEGWANDESTLASETAKRLRSTHHGLTVSAKNIAELRDVFGTFDEPLADTSLIPTLLLCRAVRQHVTVALSGDGGDEVFGGYRWYRHVEQPSRLKRLAFLADPVLRALGMDRSAFGRRCSPVQHYLNMTSPGYTLQDAKALFPWLNQERLPDRETQLYESHYRPDAGAYRRWQLVDIGTFLVSNNLMKADRVSMSVGLEVRVPLLDHRLVGFGLSLPEPLRINTTESKVMLRRYLSRIGLGHVLAHPKQGFSCPIDRYWPVPEQVQGVLQGRLVADGILSRAECAQRFQAQAPINSYHLWLLVVLEEWYRRWMA